MLSTMTDHLSLDAADRKILRLMQQDASITLDKLARRAGLSTSAAQRRLTRLREAKVIQTEVAILDPKKVGGLLTFIVELELERDRPELLPDLHRWIERSESFQQAWYVTGRGDLLVVVNAQSIESYDALMERFMADNRNVRKFTTSVALKTLKRGLSVPV
jgi:Lrp/AsnC family transcriptional regulator, leucine-responsive regulatory protein